ncbi:Hypothetical predicted protein [Scomber scombrus]|uniref:Uncharacterized protein n=1 Tax=Scomber scombrus TaxID=13677 RepID=A0AAV1MXK8_SCOSC
MYPPKPAEKRLHQLLHNHIYAKLNATPPPQPIPPLEKRPESMLQRLPFLSYSSLPPLPGSALLCGPWPSIHALSVLTEAQGPARMEPIQQPASRCSTKQSSRLQQGAEEGREQEREIGI